MWLGAGQISFSGILKTGKGNLFRCKYPLHDGDPQRSYSVALCAAASKDIGFFCLGLMPVGDATENIFSSKWPLTGWTEYCPSVCPLASECKTSGTEESSERTTAPTWSSSRLKGPGKLYDSQKDDMMVRRTGMCLRRVGANVNQFLPVPFAKRQDVEESARGPLLKDKRSADFPEPLWFCFSGLSLRRCFEYVINAL